MNNQRSIGFDIYRILLAISVVLVHCCTYSTGGALKNVEMNTPSYFIGWLLFAFVIPAVNSYALMSGYLSYGHRHTLKKPLVFYLELLFYSVIIALIAKIFIPVSTKELLMAFAPLSSGTWWYINVFIIVSVLMPGLDYLVMNTSWIKYRNIVVLLLALICGSNTLCVHQDVWFLHDGYTPVWIAFLYVIGAGIKKYKLYERLSHSVWGALWFSSVLLTASSRFVIDNLTTMLLGNKLGGGLLFNYLSITVVASAFCSLCFVATVGNHEHSRIISYLAAGSFASYVIHVQPQFLKQFIQGRFLSYGDESVLVSTVEMVGVATLIVFISSAMDGVRAWLFKKAEEMAVKNNLLRFFN